MSPSFSYSPLTFSPKTSIWLLKKWCLILKAAQTKVLGHVTHNKSIISTWWWCIALTPLSLLSLFCRRVPKHSGFRTTTGVHLHTGFKNVASLWPVCCPRPLETEGGEAAVPGNTRSLWQPPSSTNMCSYAACVENCCIKHSSHKEENTLLILFCHIAQPTQTAVNSHYDSSHVYVLMLNL